MKKIVPLLIATAMIFSGCGSTKNASNENTKTSQAPQEIYIFAGKVQADNSVNLMTKLPAKVAELKVDVGSKVNAGDPIIVLDTQDIQAQVNQAQAAVETAQANLDKVQSGSRPEQIASAQASLEGAQKSYELAQAAYDRQKQLFDTGAVSKQELEKSESPLVAAKAQCEAAQHQLDMLKNGATQQEISAASAQVKQAQAAVETAKINLNYGTITSPISGTVTAKNINVGEMAITGQNLVTIVNSGQLHIDGYVPSDLVAQLKIGQPVVVKVSDVSDKKFQGEISVIDSQIDSRNKQVLVKVTLKDGSDVLKPGMFAEIGLNK